MVLGPLQAMHSPTRLPPRDLAANQLLGGWVGGSGDTHWVETDILSTVQSWTPTPQICTGFALFFSVPHRELFVGGAKTCVGRGPVPLAREDPSGMEKPRTKCPKEKDQPSQGHGCSRLMGTHQGPKLQHLGCLQAEPFDTAPLTSLAN